MNKEILAVALALMICSVANAQFKKNKTAIVEPAPVVDEWNDVEVFEQHKLYPRANVIPYGNENAIEKNGYAESP